MIGRKKRRSFKNQILIAFCIISIIPVFFMALWSYSNTAGIVSDNVQELSDINLQQTSKSINTILESYGDVLYQIYTDENIVELTDALATGEDPARKSQLIRELRTYANVKNGVQGVTVILKDSDEEEYTTVFYDMITGGSTKNSWQDTFSLDEAELFQEISENVGSVRYGTEYAMTTGERSYYMLHIANRVVDYRDLEKRNAVVLLSIDEEILNQICNQESNRLDDGTYEGITFILDQNRRIISFPEDRLCGTYIPSSSDQPEADIYEFVAGMNIMDSGHLEMQTYDDPDTGWTYVNISDQGAVVQKLKEQQQIILMVALISVAALIVVIAVISTHLTRSIREVTETMKKAEEGDLQVRIPSDEKMPIEIGEIADQFNHMIGEVNLSIENEKAALVSQKNAEIAALEAQINPHFLYNILDTINWMAIEKDEYEISNTINALAKILRYGIDKSNEMVPIRREVEWLKQYVFLQQIRLNNKFEFRLDVAAELMEVEIHKLMFQPFIENAIIHGFEGVDREHLLELEIKEDEEHIRICIRDNGKGMSEAMVAEFRSADFKDEAESSHIGVGNAIGRMQMYYGDEAEFEINSVPGEGTEIILIIPERGSR